VGRSPGPSGAGKTTLLRPSRRARRRRRLGVAGNGSRCRFWGCSPHTRRMAYRATTLGILEPALCAFALARSDVPAVGRPPRLDLAGGDAARVVPTALRLLEQVGLADRASRCRERCRVGSSSGSRSARRSPRPRLLLADEPGRASSTRRVRRSSTGSSGELVHDARANRDRRTVTIPPPSRLPTAIVRIRDGRSGRGVVAGIAVPPRRRVAAGGFASLSRSCATSVASQLIHRVRASSANRIVAHRGRG